MSPRREAPAPKGQWYCGHCAGHLHIDCTECFGGCTECAGIGRVPCPTCKGGTVPVPPPEWVKRF